jgi:hypothetical protein
MSTMPRYVVEQTFPEEFTLTFDTGTTLREVIGNNAREQVVWLHTYVSADKRRLFGIYEAPSPEAIRRAARRNDWPVDRITEVRVLDPYSHA